MCVFTCTEAESVGRSQDPRAVVGRSKVHEVQHALPDPPLGLDQRAVVTVRCVYRVTQHQVARQQVEAARDEEGQAPCEERVVPCGHVEHDTRHEDLDEASACVAPPSSDGGGEPDHLGAEKGRGHVLVDDEASQLHADDEPACVEALHGLYEGHAEYRGHGEQDHACHGVAGTEVVTGDPSEEAHDDVARECHEPSVSNFWPGDAQVLPDDGHEGRRREGGHEGGEEGEDVDVERAHMRATEGENVELGGLVFRVYRDLWGGLCAILEERVNDRERDRKGREGGGGWTYRESVSVDVLWDDPAAAGRCGGLPSHFR